MDYSLLSQANSVICAEEKEYCCADGVDWCAQCIVTSPWSPTWKILVLTSATRGRSCCDEDSPGAKCSDSCEAATTDPSIQCLDPPLCKSRCVPFGGAAACSASTGEQTKCSDSKNPINQVRLLANTRAWFGWLQWDRVWEDGWSVGNCKPTAVRGSKRS
jgi:hypothetical protein